MVELLGLFCPLSASLTVIVPVMVRSAMLLPSFTFFVTGTTVAVRFDDDIFYILLG